MCLLIFIFEYVCPGLIFDLENVVLHTKPVYWPACQVHSGLVY